MITTDAAARQTGPRLAALRAGLARAGVQACIVPSSDPHMSEYLPEHWQGRRWLSGFGGSAGTLLVTAELAGLWTDSRYWIKAQQDLEGSGIALMRAGEPGVPEPVDWLVGKLPEGARIAVDGNVLPLRTARDWSRRLEAAGLELLTGIDPLQQVWQDRPALPVAGVWEHLPPHACRTRGDNLQALRDAMQQAGASHHLISSLDDIAWLFNLRGSDVPYNPVFLAHALIGPEGATLFVDPGKLDAALVERLAADGIQIQRYERVTAALRELEPEAVLLVDPLRVSSGLMHSCAAQITESTNPAQLLKSRKTGEEVAHIRRVMETDGAALCDFFAWFEAASGHEPITELTIEAELARARARRPNFVSPSFGTIAAFGANAAMPHYQATESAHAAIGPDGLLLIDSGGQYLGGTTDITRVVPVGHVTEEQRRDYTAVLKGMIALSQAEFPSGTPAPALDVLARSPIWRHGVEYGHGTGHEVGYFLNVHEGPQSISYRAHGRPHMEMLPGMVTSNEPGIYRAGLWGIRIENLVLCVPAQSTAFGEFLAFETLTLCPIDTRCIALAMMDAAEIRWLDDYHAEVRRRLAPHVDGRAREWLWKRTEPLGTPGYNPNFPL